MGVVGTDYSPDAFDLASWRLRPPLDVMLAPGPANLTNSTGNSTAGYDRDEALARGEFATLAVMFVVAVVGNACLLYALCARRRVKKFTRMYFFILHLSIADLIVAMLNVMPQLAWDITYRFKGGQVLCKLVKFLQPLGTYLSSYILLATALDRYRAICQPMSYCSSDSRRSRFMVAAAWCAALLFCIPQVIIFSYQEVSPGVYDCWGTFAEGWGERAYVTWYSVSVFIVPLCVLVYTYSCICREIWERSGFRAAHAARSSPLKMNPSVSRAKINTVKQTVAVILLYIACSLPFIGAQLWYAWDPQANENDFFKGAAFTILVLLSSLNSCANPWIYLAFNKELARLLVSCGDPRTHADLMGGSGSSSTSWRNSRVYRLVSGSAFRHRESSRERRWAMAMPTKIPIATALMAGRNLPSTSQEPS
ncbi:oxytocin receptor-like [Bacillus rossius redtenbacheri]|uniref:oxytocin receptor-like n=1 Tax=Bacillus rossius redtenbacheri TaxID=93214 RepID=UPI002FDD0037